MHVLEILVFVNDVNGLLGFSPCGNGKILLEPCVVCVTGSAITRGSLCDPLGEHANRRHPTCRQTGFFPDCSHECAFQFQEEFCGVVCPLQSSRRPAKDQD